MEHAPQVASLRPSAAVGANAAGVRLGARPTPFARVRHPGVSYQTEVRTVAEPDRGHRPTFLICGMVHLVSRGDWHIVDAGDVRSPQRTQEMNDVVARLGDFEPTQVAVERVVGDQGALDAHYRAYRAHMADLDASEEQQIGFRTAARLGLDRVQAVDWMDLIPGQRAFGEVMAWAQTHQPPLYEELSGGGPGSISIDDRSLLDVLREVNQPDRDRASHTSYLRLAQIGTAADPEATYVGLDWLTWWYRRNLTIFVNLMRLATTPDDRILLLIGAGHRFLLNQFLRDSERCHVDEAIRYLG